MKQEEEENLNQLLLVDLCARLPYGVTVLFNNIRCVVENIGRDGSISLIGNDNGIEKAIYLTKVNFVKPYLRSMSSMTEEEKKTFSSMSSHSIDCLHRFLSYSSEWYYFIHNEIDWLNAHHFDYRGLIERGLALEAPEGMYK